ncbi:MAG: hypothetical protein QOI38_68 [Sphingomonadales bacterium]|jgi:hypothetical protein|nr:hypothetical protein [Sphingomonadales bacterium]
MPILNEQLEILGAAYGLADVAAKVRAAVDQGASPNTLSIRADNATFGDSWPGFAKTLTLVCRYGPDGAPVTKAVRENETLTLGQAEYDASRAGASDTPPRSGDKLTIWGASYGPADVTAALRARVGGDQTLGFTADNATFGDSWPGVRKTCVIVSSYGGGGGLDTDIVIESAASATMPGDDLQILGAAYGKADVTGAVAAAVDRNADPNTLAVAADNATFGDSWPGIPKTLTLVCRYGSDGAPVVKVAREGERLAVGAADHAASLGNPSPETRSPGFLTLWGASYGPQDVTDKAGAFCGSDQALSLTADNATFGDSWPGVRKACVLVSSYYPQPPVVTITEEDGNCKLVPPSL